MRNVNSRELLWTSTRFEINDVLRSSTRIQHTYVPLKFEVNCVRTPKHKYFWERPGPGKVICLGPEGCLCSLEFFFFFLIEEFCFVFIQFH